MVSEVKANKISPATGTALTLGDSGDTFTVPSGATIVNSGTAIGFGVVQMVYDSSAQQYAVATGTTNIPIDDTVPLISEGDQYMNVSITPQSASNILVVQHVGYYSDSLAGGPKVAIFAGSTCVGATEYGHPTGSLHSGGDVDPLSVTAIFVAGTTSALAITIRAGSHQDAATLSFNGKAGVRRYGATPKSSLIVTEYTP